MELKNQILLVILIPILLILCLAVLQVGLLSFVNIPAFQDTLLEYNIERHIGGLNILLNVITQQIFIQHQAYFNQLLGIAAHLRFYSLGEFTSQNSWNFTKLNIPEYSLYHNKNDPNRTIDWYYPGYTNLTSLKKQKPDIYYKIMNSSLSLHLGDILINPDPIELRNSLYTNFTVITGDDDQDEQSSILYEYTQLHCTDGLLLRYPAYNDTQIRTMKQDDEFDILKYEGLPINKRKVGGGLNFTLDQANPIKNFTNKTGFVMQQILTNEDGITCVFNSKVINNYLNQVTVSDYNEHMNQQEQGHQLFIALIDKDNHTFTMAPDDYTNLTLAQAIYDRFDYDNLTNRSAPNKTLLQPVHDTIVKLTEQITENPNATNYVQIQIASASIYVIVNVVTIESDKTFQIIKDDTTNISYLHISPLTNNYTAQTFLLASTFDRQSLIDDLYSNNTLQNVKVLEIVVFIVIVVLSIIIFIFVYYTATRIGLSFEQPIRVLTEFMNSIDIQNMEQEEELMAYEDYFNSFEIKALFKTMNIFITTIKYSNQKYSNSKHSDAIALMELSKAKDFYKKEIGNMSAVGICANNIGILHMKGQRVFEAVNEMEEAIFIAKQELQEIKELKEWCKRMQTSYQEPNFLSTLKHKMQGFANKFRQLEFNWVTRQRRKSESFKKIHKQHSRFNTSNKITHTVSKNLSVTQLNSKSGMPHIALLANRNTPIPSGNMTNQLSGMATPKVGFHYQSDHFSSNNRRDRNDMRSNQYEKQELISMEHDQMSPHPSPQNGKSKYFGQSQNQSSIIQSQRADLRESILQDGKSRASMGDTTQQNFQTNQTELDMLADKISELKKKKQLVRAKLQNRQFQLAQFMFNICMHYSDVFIPETLSLFEQFEQVSEKSQRQTPSKLVRMINLYVKKALCYIQIGDIQKFKVEHQHAKEIYDKLEKDQHNLDHDLNEEQDFNFVDMFKNVPLEVLKSKILQLDAIHELLKGNFQSSARILTEIIEMGEYYDPEVRDFCLVLLENIFKLFNLPTQSIKQFQSQVSINIYEIVIMIDYSKEMSIEQINLSHSIATQIFAILQPQDLVGMYGFNNSLHEAFPLQPKGTYQDLLQKQLYMAITAPGGSSRLYKALKFAVKNFFEHRMEFQTKMNQVKLIFDQSQQAPSNGQATSKFIDLPDKTQSKADGISKNMDSESGIIRQEADEQGGDNDLSNAEKRVSSEESSDSEMEFQLYRQEETTARGTNTQVKYEDYRSSYKYICLFTEINKHPTVKQQAKLQKLLLDNSVDLLVFNIANQNANMLDLKQLSKITPRSMFVNANANLENIFGKSRQNLLQKKMYLEFF